MKKSHRDRSCRGKRQYSTHQSAKKAAEQVQQLDHNHMRAYRCAYCFFWHVGHDKYWYLKP